jgi:hypothetical protein
MLRPTNSCSGERRRIFEAVEELSEKLVKTGYFIDPTMTKTGFIVAKRSGSLRR